MRIETIKAHESSAIEAIVHLRVGFPALRASYTTCITTLSNGKKIQQTFVEKAVGQTVEAISFWQIDRCLTLGASKFSFFLAHSCMFLQTLAAERVETRYNFRFIKGIQTNAASNLLLDVFQKRLHNDRQTRKDVIESNKQLTPGRD